MSTATCPDTFWQALAATQGPVPWDAIRGLAAALSSDPALQEELGRRYEEVLRDPYGKKDFQCVYLPAVMRLAAPGLDAAGRDRIARFLVDRMLHLEIDDDWLPDALACAFGALGPEALPALLDALPQLGPDNVMWFPAWSLTGMAAQSSDAALRQRVAEACENLLRRVVAGEVKPLEGMDAAWTLAEMKHLPARALIEQAADTARRNGRSIFPLLTGEGDYRHALRVLDGEDPEGDDRPWHHPLEPWVDQQRSALADWYAQESAGDDDGDDGADTAGGEDDYEAGERRAYDLAEQFAQSDQAGALTAEQQRHSRFVAGCMLQYARSYEDCEPGKLNRRALRAVLFEHFPRKVSAEREVFEAVAPVTKALLAWLQGQGLIRDGNELVAEVDRCADRIVGEGMDRNNWGMGKCFTMDALAAGVDMTDRQAMDRFMLEYNARLLAQMAKKDERLPVAVDPYEGLNNLLPPVERCVREGPKIGRNAPCPCGSGKKYKKCCGRQ